MDHKVEIHSKKRKFNGFLKVDEIDLSHERYDGGINSHQKVLVLERGDACAAFVHDVKRKKVILIEQFRYPTYEKGPGWIVETVAGGISDGESAEDCIRRELLEEIGYNVKTVIPIHSFYVSPGGSTERIHLFYTPVTRRNLVNAKATGCEDEGEDIRQFEMSELEFFRALDRGDFQDAKLIIAGHWFRRYRALQKRRKKKK